MRELIIVPHKQTTLHTMFSFPISKPFIASGKNASWLRTNLIAITKRSFADAYRFHAFSGGRCGYTYNSNRQKCRQCARRNVNNECSRNVVMNALAAAWFETGSAIRKRYTPTWNSARNYFRANSRTGRKLLRCLRSIRAPSARELRISVIESADHGNILLGRLDLSCQRSAILSFNCLITGLIAYNNAWSSWAIQPSINRARVTKLYVSYTAPSESLPQRCQYRGC